MNRVDAPAALTEIEAQCLDQDFSERQIARLCREIASGRFCQSVLTQAGQRGSHSDKSHTHVILICAGFYRIAMRDRVAPFYGVSRFHTRIQLDYNAVNGIGFKREA